MNRIHSGRQVNCQFGINTSIAPAMAQIFLKLRTLRPVMPPSAAQRAGRASRARRRQPSAPSPGAPAWLLVAKAGEMNITSAPARRARTTSRALWAEDVTIPGKGCTPRRPPRKCSPARSAAASRASPATTKIRRRARQSAATRRASATRSAAPSCRNTTPHNPRGNRPITGSGSGRRA